MINLEKLPPELSFLENIIGDRKQLYRENIYLKSSFDANIWHLIFKKKQIIIDFNVQLYDGSFLTEPQHHNLLEILKCWICLQNHPGTLPGEPMK